MADFDPDKTYNAILRAGEEWADADAAASMLEETRKSVLAKAMLESSSTSHAAREMYALADPKYTEFLTAMVNARKTANKHRVRYDSAKTLAELRRSQESTKRAEMALR